MALTVDCDLRKWGEKPHYRFEMDLLGRDEHGTWLAGRPPIPFEGPEYPGTFLQRFALLVPEDRWWLASFNEEGPHTDIEIYVDVATPSVWTSETHVTAVDLDLDVVLRRDATLYIDDEDEFEEHLVLYGYPDDVIETARRTAAEIYQAVGERHEPFGEVGRAWLAKV